ncbi:olfactory receptor 1019-like [Trichosurus vulpecula]|uniref:olfactory receptor 1019-like n=1 Tax=Trichosurus vulpecula TaxID=9337 RepID=UPI00186B0CF2|nr:olfactory receptor 1019-like [Trichosurus vulpecula]
MQLSLMEDGNVTTVSEFVLWGISEDPEQRKPLFGLFLLMYTVTLVGNLGLIFLIKIYPKLHTPMYFFLSHLSFLDSCYSSVTAPRILRDLLSENKVISWSGCMTQLGLFIVLASAELYLLASMAYDRYVAICNPLLYPILMSSRACTSLVVVCYTVGIVNSLTVTSSISMLSFCRANMVKSFFCDIRPLLALSCSDTQVCNILVFAFGAFIQMSSLLVIVVSYTFIVIAIMRIRLAEGKRKAFSTCASHMTTVSLFYGTLIFIYLRPTSNSAPNQDQVVSIFYTMVIPMLNPVIYSLRNQEVKQALKKLLYKGQVVQE